MVNHASDYDIGPDRTELRSKSSVAYPFSIQQDARTYGKTNGRGWRMLTDYSSERRHGDILPRCWSSRSKSLSHTQRGQTGATDKETQDLRKSTGT